MDKVSSELSSSSPSDKKLSVADLKAYLKDAGVSATGDKVSLWWRCKTHHTVVTLGLVTADGGIPTKLKTAQLRKEAARFGVSPIGTPDEMLDGLVGYLMKEKRKNEVVYDGAAAASDPTTSCGKKCNGRKATGPGLAEAVLSLADASIMSPIRVLQLSDPALEPTSPTADLRKAYLKISLHIHPDRIGSEFKDATKAFQVLVTAYETLTSPDYIPSVDEPVTAKGKKKKTAQISRSNEGCFQTKLYCPRCYTRWGDKVEGNPGWYYNIMMQGLKSFHCATCLLKFGCMSAQHRCPWVSDHVPCSHIFSGCKNLCPTDAFFVAALLPPIIFCSAASPSHTLQRTTTERLHARHHGAKSPLVSTCTTCRTSPSAICVRTFCRREMTPPRSWQG